MMRVAVDAIISIVLTAVVIAVVIAFAVPNLIIDENATAQQTPTDQGAVGIEQDSSDALVALLSKSDGNIESLLSAVYKDRRFSLESSDATMYDPEQDICLVSPDALVTVKFMNSHYTYRIIQSEEFKRAFPCTLHEITGTDGIRYTVYSAGCSEDECNYFYDEYELECDQGEIGHVFRIEKTDPSAEQVSETYVLSTGTMILKQTYTSVVYAENGYFFKHKIIPLEKAN